MRSPAGTASDEPAQTRAACERCEYGTISEAGSTECLLCTDLQPNTFSSPDRTACLECPSGYYAINYNIDPATLPGAEAYFNETGTVLVPWPSPYICHPCPDNTWRQAGQATCTDISAGFVLRAVLDSDTRDVSVLNGTFISVNDTLNGTLTFIPSNTTRRMLHPRSPLHTRLRSMSVQELEDTFILPRLQRHAEQRRRRLQDTGRYDGQTSHNDR